MEARTDRRDTAEAGTLPPGSAKPIRENRMPTRAVPALRALRADHLAHPCFDVEATHRFYANALQLPLAFALSGPSEEWGGDFLLLAYALGDGRCLDFFAVSGLQRPPPDGLPPDMRHVGLTAGTRAAVQRWKSRLDRQHIAWRAEDHGDGDEHLYFADPNGLILEIAARSDLSRMRDPAAARAVLSRWTAAGGRHIARGQG
jgi:catechol 2,3-dioxygenase-like lactoylglutathione lyase family enzyme